MANVGARYVEIDAEKLKTRRLQMGLTQEGLSEISKVSINTISAYERNASQANLASAKALADALNMDIADLCTPPAVTVASIPKGGMEKNTTRLQNPPLKILCPSNKVLEMAAAGLEKEEGSDEKVSLAIASITGYLGPVVYRAPELKKHTLGLVTAITSALSSAALDTSHPSSTEFLWSGIKNGIAELMELNCLPEQAKREASSVLASLQQARLDNDDVQRLLAVKSALFWLHDYWTSVCMEKSAYNVLSGVSCIMVSAPTDYVTRSCLVAQVNYLVSLVAVYDPVQRMICELERNK